MGIREQTKQLLRMCGHAFVRTVHERLDVLDRRINDFGVEHAGLAESQTALLQAVISLVENMHRVQEECQQEAEATREQPRHLADLQAEIAGLTATTRSSDAALLANGNLQRLDCQRQTEELRDLHLRVDGLQAEIAGLTASIRTSDAALLANGNLLRLDCQRQAEELRDLRQRMEDLQAEAANLTAAARASATKLLEREDLLQRDCQGRIGALEQRSAELDTLCVGFSRLEVAVRASAASVAALERKALPASELGQPPRVFVETDDYEFRNPEVGLMAFLVSVLPTRKAIDAGAHVGEVSARLLAAGYEVYAFEPNPEVYGRLMQRLGGHGGFHPFNVALGSSEATMPLHLARDLSGCAKYEDESVFGSLLLHSMPEDLPFQATLPTVVKSLAGLHRDGLLPEDIGLTKIDTEGYDLEVVRGMEEYRYPAVVAEFWDSQMPFGISGTPYTLETLSGEMRDRGYPYYIVIYRIWGQDGVSYYCNRGRSLPGAYGNAFFFTEHSVFGRAQAWCSAVLPETYFGPRRSN